MTVTSNVSSEYTKHKEEIFGKIFAALQQSGSIHIEAAAGEGSYSVGGVQFDGSPIVALKLAKKLGLTGMRFIFFERDPRCFSDLVTLLGPWMADGYDIVPICGDSRDVLVPTVSAIASAEQPGLLYTDPCQATLPFQATGQLADTMENLDVLNHIGATGIKRTSKGRPVLKSALKNLCRKYTLISAPQTNHQWVFYFSTKHKTSVDAVMGVVDDDFFVSTKTAEGKRRLKAVTETVTKPRRSNDASTERKILKLLAQGFSYHEVAKAAGVSMNVVWSVKRAAKLAAKLIK